MSTAIRYYSKFGHSEKLAAAIGKVVNVVPENVSVPLNEDVDTLYIVCGLFLGKVNKDMIQFIKNLKPGQVREAVLVGSSAIIQDPVKEMRDTLKACGISVSEREFICKGAMGPVHKGHPDAKDIEALTSFVLNK